MELPWFSKSLTTIIKRISPANLIIKVNNILLSFIQIKCTKKTKKIDSLIMKSLLGSLTMISGKDSHGRRSNPFP